MGTVTVACRVRTGIELRVTEPRDDGTGLKQQRHVGPALRLLGPDNLGAEIVGGFAINRRVDADLWNAWLEQNRLNPLVVHGELNATADPEGEAPPQE